MKTLEFKKIDAFTKGESLGNPAGYVYLRPAEPLREDEMQRVARELKGYVNEVGFVSKIDEGYKLRFFSSECEVEFCGHATIAIMYDLLSNERTDVKKAEVFIQVNAGVLSVFNQITENDAVYIMAPPPKYLNCPVNKTEVAKALRVETEDLREDRPLRLIDGGLRTLLVSIKSLNKCLEIYPNQEELRQFCLENEIDILHISTEEAYTSAASYRARVFAPKYGYLEDPATGSGNAAFGYYLMKENLWTEDFTVEQGPDRENPNFVKLRKYEKEGNTHILFGGCATKRIEGSYFIV